MASSIDALIAQGPRPPQVDPNAIPNRIITLRQAMQQQQMGQEQLEAQRQENEQRAIQMDQTRALNAAYQAALTTDPNTGTPTINRDTLTHALAQAGHGSAIPGIMKSLNDYDLSNVNLQKARDEVAKAETEHAGSLGASVRAANYDPQLFNTLMTDAVRQKHVPQQMVAPMIGQVAQALQQDPTGASARKLVQQYSDQMIAGSEKQRELDAATTTANARATTANVDQGKAQLAKDTQFLNQAAGAQSQDQLDQMRSNAKAAGVSDAAIQRIPAMYSPDAMTAFGRSLMSAQERTTADQAAANAAETAKRDQQTANYQQGELKQGATRNLIEQGRLDTDRQRLGFEMAPVGANGQPSASPAATMAAQGRMSPQTLRSLLRSQPGLLGQIQQIDPKFDEGKIEQRYDVINDFNKSTPTSGGGQALALNTLIHHADLYQQAAAALKNGTFRPGNQVYNAIVTEFGKAPPTNAALVAQFFAGETGKVATGGVPAEGELNKVLANLQNSNSPDQIAGAGKTLLQIAAGRAIPLMEKVKSAGADNVVHVIGDDAKQILARNGFDPNTMQPVKAGGPKPGQITVRAGGKEYYFNSQAQADTFKKNAGIQ